MTLSTMRQLLADRQILLTKSLGQNFLHDGNQLRRMIELAELQPNDRVFEIGPGLGPLTERLLAVAAEILAVEKDARLVEVLRERLAAEPKLRLIHGDVLDRLARPGDDWTDWKLVANLPYSVASVILVELALARTCPERLVITLQHEVGQRLTAPPGSAAYGVLTLLVQQRYAVDASFRIPASCFFPPPDIDSVCVRLRRHTAERLTPPERLVFVRLVKLAFSERRKMMLKLLKRAWDETTLRAALQAEQLLPSCRAETVGLHQFEALARHLAAAMPAGPSLPRRPAEDREDSRSNRTSGSPRPPATDLPVAMLDQPAPHAVSPPNPSPPFAP